MLDRLRTLSPERQFLLVLATMVLVFAILFGGWSLLRTPYRSLFTGLKPEDAAAIVAELDHKKTPYRLADNGSTILVPADRADATRLDLMNGQLALKGTVGFEIFNKADLGLTDFAQRINYQRALQGELERTIMTLDGVESVRVHLSLGENRIFREDRIAPKGSVTIHMHQGAVLPASAADGVQRLVAAAVPQLDPSDVVILDEMGQLIRTGVTMPASEPADEFDPEQKAISDYYTARIQETLASAGFSTSKITVRPLSAPDSADGAPQNSREKGWTPGSRDFPLEIRVDAGSPSDTERQSIRAAIARAVDLNPAHSDLIEFGRIDGSPKASAAIAPPPLSHPIQAAPLSASATEPATFFPISWIIGAGLAGLGLILLLVRGGRRGKPMSPAERSQAAARLKGLLSEDEHDAARR